MKFLASRTATALAVLAAATLTASPALARDRHYGGWDHHHRHRGGGIDGGDVLAGLLIVGGIAAIATAVSNADNQDRAETPPRSYPGGPDYRVDQSDGYGDAPDYPGDDGRGYDGSSYGGSDYRGDTPQGGAQSQGSFDRAVDACSAELERGDRRIDSVETVGRMGDRFNVQGRLSDGRGYACSVDVDGRIRSAAVDGQAVI